MVIRPLQNETAPTEYTRHGSYDQTVPASGSHARFRWPKNNYDETPMVDAQACVHSNARSGLAMNLNGVCSSLWEHDMADRYSKIMTGRLLEIWMIRRERYAR